MKKIFYIFAVLLFMCTGCAKDGERIVNQLAGDWHYTAEESGVKEDVWISFTEDNTFEMYQRVGDGAYWYSRGDFEYDVDSKILSGVYSDRYPWKYTYRISVSDRTLEMKAVEIETHVMTYTRESIPADVRDKSLPLTKSEDIERYL